MHGNGFENKAEYAPRSSYLRVYGGQYEVTMTDPTTSSNGDGDVRDAVVRAPEESPLLRPTQWGTRSSQLERLLLDIIDEALAIVGTDVVQGGGEAILSHKRGNGIVHRGDETIDDRYEREVGEIMLAIDGSGRLAEGESSRGFGLNTNELHRCTSLDTLSSSVEPETETEDP